MSDQELMIDQVGDLNTRIGYAGGSGKDEEFEITGGRGITQWSQMLDHGSWEGMGLGARSKGEPYAWRATPLPPSLEG